MMFPLRVVVSLGIYKHVAHAELSTEIPLSGERQQDVDRSKKKKKGEEVFKKKKGRGVILEAKKGEKSFFFSPFSRSLLLFSVFLFFLRDCLSLFFFFLALSQQTKSRVKRKKKRVNGCGVSANGTPREHASRHLRRQPWRVSVLGRGARCAVVD